MSEQLIEGEIIVKDEQKWPEIYKENGLQTFMDQIEKNIIELAKEVPDVSTEKGRERIGSLARKVSSSKTAIDNPGREYLRQMKAKIKPTEVELKRWVDFCDEKRDEILAPRKEWEQREKDRIAGHQETMERMQSYVDPCHTEMSPNMINNYIHELEELEPTEAMEEFMGPATKIYKKAHAYLIDCHQKAAKREAEQAELERLRAEQAEREQKEREAKIAQEAAENARIEAEREAKAEQEAAAKREAEAKAAAERAEQARIDAETKAKQDAIEAVERQKAAVKAAEEKAQRETMEAKEREITEAKKREDNKKHHAKINNEAVADLVAGGINEKVAKEAITLIAQRKVSNVEIKY